MVDWLRLEIRKKKEGIFLEPIDFELGKQKKNERKKT